MSYSGSLYITIRALDNKWVAGWTRSSFEGEGDSREEALSNLAMLLDAARCDVLEAISMSSTAASMRDVKLAELQRTGQWPGSVDVGMWNRAFALSMDTWKMPTRPTTGADYTPVTQVADRRIGVDEEVLRSMERDPGARASWELIPALIAEHREVSELLGIEMAERARMQDVFKHAMSIVENWDESEIREEGTWMRMLWDLVQAVPK